MLCLLYSPLRQKIASAYFTTYIRGLPFFFFSQVGGFWEFNPRTYTQIHTPTVVQGGGGGGAGWIEPIPAVFNMLQYFETIVGLVESL